MNRMVAGAGLKLALTPFDVHRCRPSQLIAQKRSVACHSGDDNKGGCARVPYRLQFGLLQERGVSASSPYRRRHSKRQLLADS
jgi:hypothetical protein